MQSVFTGNESIIMFHILFFSFLCFLRPTRAIAKDITKLSNAGSSHDCGSLSRVVMVRKTDQRVFNRKSQKVSIDLQFRYLIHVLT